MERNSRRLASYVVVERMQVFEKHLLIEDLEGCHFIAEKQLNAAVRQVTYLPNYGIERTH